MATRPYRRSLTSSGGHQLKVANLLDAELPNYPRPANLSGAILSTVGPTCAGDLMATPHDLLACIRSVATTADRDAFAALFSHFAPRVKGFLMQSGMAAELAEELAQEAMVTLWCKAAQFDPSRGSLSTWVFTITRNLRIDHYRRLPGGSHIDFEEWGDDQQPADGRATPEQVASTLQRQTELRVALSELTPEQALVIRLSFLEEQTHMRIAEELNIPLGTVKSRIRRALLQLRRALECRFP